MNRLLRTLAIVDDHLSFRQTIGRFLVSSGFEVVLEAGNGMEFLASLERASNLPGACLLDMEMPVMDGPATAGALRERYPAIKVVAITLSRNDARTQRMKDAGVCCILHKNMDPMDLRDVLF